MDNNQNNQNNQTDKTAQGQRAVLPTDLLTRPYNQQITLILAQIIPAAVTAWAEAGHRLGADEITAFDVCATLAIGCVELRTYLITSIDLDFCSRFALDMPGVPYVDRALWEIVHLPQFEQIPHAHLLPFTQEQMRLAVVAQIASDMAGARITGPLTADLLDQQIKAEEQQTRTSVQSGDLTGFSMATETDRAISLIRLRLAGMDGVAVTVKRSRLPAFLKDVTRRFPTASIGIVQEGDSGPTSSPDTSDKTTSDKTASDKTTATTTHDWFKA